MRGKACETQDGVCCDPVAGGVCVRVGRGRKALEANMLSLLEGDCIEWTALGSRCRCSETIWLAF